MVKVSAFHGTDAEFDEFDPKRIGSGTDTGLLGAGFYFSTDQAVCRSSKRCVAVRLNLRKPLRIDYPNWGADKTALVNEILGTKVNAGAPLTRALQNAGHDAVILDFSPVGYRQQEIVVFDAGQIEIKGGRNPMADSLDKYVRSIRNVKKKAYAQRYVRWIRGGRSGSEPDEGGLSFMGAQAVRLRVAEIRRGNPMAKENPTHNIGPFSGTVDYSKSTVDRFTERGRGIVEPKKKEIELTSGGMIRLRNPEGQASCPGCRGLIENPKVGTGKCSGCGAIVVIERDTSGFYQPAKNPHKAKKGQTYQEAYDEWVNFLSDGKGKKALSAEELRHVARLARETVSGKNPGQPFFEEDNSGLYTAGSPRGVVGNPKAKSIQMTVEKRSKGGWVVVTKINGTTSRTFFRTKREVDDLLKSLKAVTARRNPEGGFEYDFSGFYSQRQRGPYLVLNPRHKKRRYSNPHSADIQKGSCPTCGANLILANGVEGGSCPKCQSAVRVG